MNCKYILCNNRLVFVKLVGNYQHFYHPPISWSHKQKQIRRQFSRWHQKLEFLQNINKILKMRPIRVSVEGNIGSGKSTLMEYFKRFPSIQTNDEPLDKWRNLNGHNLLGLLYEDLTKWNATFQSYVQLTRTQIQSAKTADNIRVQLFERSVQNNRHCFMENAFRSGLLTPPEFQVLSSWYDWIEENVDISLDLIVYLRSSPDVVFDRIRARNRPEEKSITKEYLVSLHEAHERWLTDPKLKTAVCVIDANSAMSHVVKSYEDVVLPLLLKPTTLTPVPEVVKT